MQTNKTTHKILFGNAQSLTEIENQSVDLVVTSPPYPMIEMWDETFSLINPDIRKALNENNGEKSFELMHQELDEVWKELYRVTKPGGFLCINIGDATRSFSGEFQMYSNHSRILNSLIKIGFHNLPNILWRKQTNAPNKFMGSGMLPAGAYVTLEHEHILIFRKTGKRVFESKEKSKARQESAYFWEERNSWFSDVWELKGTKQKIEGSKSRERSGAYPFELAYRLINMFSVKNDTVLDPFLGTGTTTLAAIASERNSVGYEIDSRLSETIDSVLDKTNLSFVNEVLRKRITDHLSFVEKRIELKGSEAFKHENNNYGFPVITKQEQEILFSQLTRLESKSLTDSTITAHHKTLNSIEEFSDGDLFSALKIDRSKIFQENTKKEKIANLSS